MKCDCKDWTENIDKVNGPLLLQAARSGFRPEIGYHGKQFKFCPWCATSLREASKADSVSPSSNALDASGVSSQNPVSSPPAAKRSECQHSWKRVRPLEQRQCRKCGALDHELAALRADKLEVQKLTNALEVEREWVKALTKDNGALLDRETALSALLDKHGIPHD